MKKICRYKSFLLLIILFTYSSSADIHIGARVGLNLSKIAGDDVEDEYIVLLPGITGGCFINFAVTDFFALQPELLYSAKGVKWKYDSGAKDVSRVHYFEIPVNLIVSLPHKRKIDPFIYCGGAAAFFLGSVKTVTINNKDVLKESKNEGARNYDIGIDFGGGLELRVGKGNIILDVKYTLGLLSVEKEGYDEVKNRTLSILAGYGFVLGK